LDVDLDTLKYLSGNPLKFAFIDIICKISVKIVLIVLIFDRFRCEIEGNGTV